MLFLEIYYWLFKVDYETFKQEGNNQTAMKRKYPW